MIARSATDRPWPSKRIGTAFLSAISRPAAWSACARSGGCGEEMSSEILRGTEDGIVARVRGAARSGMSALSARSSAAGDPPVIRREHRRGTPSAAKNASVRGCPGASSCPSAHAV
jgi:hypothetical protein